MAANIVLLLTPEEAKVIWEIMEFHRDDEAEQVPYSRETYCSLIEGKLYDVAEQQGWLSTK